MVPAGSAGEKGTRCNSGAVPATVSQEPTAIDVTKGMSMLCLWEDGQRQGSASQETCHRVVHPAAGTSLRGSENRFFRRNDMGALTVPDHPAGAVVDQAPDTDHRRPTE